MGGRHVDAGACMEVDDVEVLLAGAIRAQEEDGDLQAGRQWFEAAYRESERAGDELVMAKAVVGLGGIWVHEHRGAAAAALMDARLHHALTLIEPDSTMALRLRIRAAAEEDYRRGRHDAVLAVVGEARSCADPVALMEALSAACHCLLGPEHADLRQELADELIGVAARAGHRGHLLMGLLWRVVHMFLTADRHAERRLSELRGMLDKRDHLAIRFVVQAIEVMMAVRAGRFDEAEHLARACRELGVKVGAADTDAWYGAQLVAIRSYQCRLAELLPMLTELMNSPTLSAVDNSFFAAHAVAAAHTGDERAAAGALAVLRGGSLSELPRSSTWLVTMCGVVEAAYLTGDAQAAATAYHLLRPFADLPMMVGLGIACFGSVHHSLGMACLTMDQLDDAVAHLREGLDRNLAIRHWPAVLGSRARLAQALERRAGPDDGAAAEAQRAAAATIAAALGIGVDTHATRQVSDVVCARHGTHWRFEADERSVTVNHSVGMLHLAVLIANPGVEIAAIDLVAGSDALSRAAKENGMSAQRILDRTAIQRYRQRLSDLRNEIDARESVGDAAGTARAYAERDWLMAEIAGATGLGGRARTFSDNRERARLAVGRAIHRALDRIERADAVIGAHLRASVHTGAHCSYRPS